MLAICAWRGLLPRVTPEHARYYAICGVLGVTIPNLNVVVVVGHIPAGVVDDTDNDIRHRPRLAPRSA
jgi:hypothetical protein